MRHDGAGSSAVGSPDGMRGGDREIREQKKRNHYRKEGAGYKEAELLVLFPPGEPGSR